jgi:hypothetical protein
MANTYRLLGARRLEDTLITDVEYSLDGVVVRVEVAHFRPTTKQQVQQAIRNRGVTEKQRVDAQVLIDSFIANLDTSG